MSKHFRITLAIIGTLVALAMAAIAVMSTRWFRHALEQRLMVTLEDMTGARVEVQEFHFHPLALQAVFNGFVLHGSEDSQAPPLFSAHTVVFRLSPTNLLHRQIRIMALDWEGAELHLRTNPDGSTNLPGPVTRLNAGQAMEQLIDLRIGRVTLAHSAFFWDDRAVKVDLSAQDVAFLLHLRRGRNYEGSLAASAVTARGPKLLASPFTFSSRFALSQNALTVSSIVWQARGMSGRGSLTFHPLPSPEAYFSFQTSLDVATLNPLLRPPDLRNGSLRLEGQGIYRHGEISARGRFQSRQMLFRNAQFDSGPFELSADFFLERSRVDVSNLKVLGWGGSALGEGQVSLAGGAPEFHFRARLRDVSPTSLLRTFNIQPRVITQLHPASLLAGVVELSWAGELEKFKSSFDLHFSSPSAPPAGFLPVTGEMQGSLERNHGFLVTLKDSSFHTPHSLLKAKGTLVDSTQHGESPGSLQIQCETGQLGEWRSVIETFIESPPPLPLALGSPATFVGEISGSMRDPHLRGALRMGKFTYRGWTWDGFQADIAAKPDSLRVSSGRLAHGTSVLSFEASAHLEDWRISKTSQVMYSARAQGTPLEGLKAALGVDYPVAGRLSGQLSLQGTSTHLAGTGSLKVVDGNLAGEPFSSFSTILRVSESTWDLDTLEMVKGHGKITGKAEINPSTRSLTCQLHGTGFRPVDFKRLSRVFADLSPPHALEGQASFDLEGSGTPDNFRFRSTGLLQDISIGGTQVGDLHVQLDGEGQNVQFQCLSSGPTGMFGLSGDAQAAGDWPFQLHGQYVSLRLDPWLRLFLNSKLDAQVNASGSFTAHGPLRNLSKFEMQGQVETLEVSFPSLKWRNEHPVEVRYADNRLSTQPFRMQGPSTDLVVDGSFRPASPASLSFTIQGVADATILSLFEPGMQASGHSRIKLSVSGSPARPLWNGAVDVQDVALEYPSVPIRLSNLNGQIQLEGAIATLQSLRGIIGGGGVTLDGHTTVAWPPRFELRAQLDQARVHYPLGLTSILSGPLRLTGTPDRSQLSGDLTLNQVLATENKPWLGQFMQPSSPFEGTPTSGISPFAKSLRLNIHVASPTPVRLQVQDLRLTGEVDVRMQGSLANPVQIGSVHFLSGEAVVRGNRFTLTRGDLSMTNPVRTQATLELEAQTRVQQYDLTVDVTGPPDRLKMAYHSDPPLPTEDVFSLLALGYAPQQQVSSTTGIVGSFAAGNPTQTIGQSALLSQALSTQVGGRIQRLFGVSRIQIDPNVGLPGFNNGERVTIEEQVAKNLTLTYITNTASSQYQIIQFEYAIGENMSLLGVRDPNGIVGVELRFRRRFK